MLPAVLALQLAAAAPQCNQGTTYDIRECWAKQDAAAAAELKSTYVAVETAFQKEGLSTESLAVSQDAWTNARDKTCAFEYNMYLPGTIAPQLGTECDLRMTQARTQHLAAWLKQKFHPPEQAGSTGVDTELNRIYKLYVARINSSQAKSLTNAQSAWSSYRNTWCAIAGGSCLTDLTNERIAELEASWIGEAFW
jgi:uncharacterized protein YecT (DUF1311 family)